MSLNLGELKAIVKLDTSDLNKNVSSGLAGMNLMSGGMAALKVGVLAVGAAMAATAVTIGAMVKQGIEGAANVEQQRIAFEHLLGSADAVNDVMNRIQKEAAVTPFSTEGLTKNTLALTTITKDGNKAIDVLLAVGDAIAASGKGAEQMDSVIVNLQQIAASGQVTQMDIKQMQMAIPLFNDIISASGLTIEGLKNSSTAAQDLFTAFQNASKEGGLTFNSMVDQSHTFNGMISTLQDSFHVLTMAIVGVDPAGNITPGGLFDKFKGIAEKLLGVLDQNKDKIADLAGKFGGVLATGLQKVIDGVIYLITNWDKLKQQATEVMQKIDLQTGAFTAMGDEVNQIVDLFKNALLPTIIKNKDTFIDLAKFIGVILIVAIEGLLIGIKYLIAIVTQVIDWVGWFHDGLKKLPETLKNVIDSIYNFGYSIGEGIAKNIDKAILYFELFKIQVTTKLTVMAQEAIAWGSNIVQGVIDGISSRIEAAKNVVQDFANSIINTFSGPSGIDSHSPSKVFTQYGEFVVDGFIQGLEASSPEAEAAMQAFSDRITEFGDAFNTLQTKAKDAADKFKSRIQEVKQSLDEFRQSIKDQRKEENNAFSTSNQDRKSTLAGNIAEEIVAMDTKKTELEQSLADEKALGDSASADKIATIQAELDQENALLAAHIADRQKYQDEITAINKFNALDAIDQMKFTFDQERAAAQVAHDDKLADLKKSLQDEEDATAASLDRIKHRRTKVFEDIQSDFKSTLDVMKQYLGDLDSSIAGTQIFTLISKIGAKLFKELGQNVTASGSVQRFATGGIVRGPGSTDSQAALLTPGETVLPPGVSPLNLNITVSGNTVQSDQGLATLIRDSVMDAISRKQEVNQLFGSI